MAGLQARPVPIGQIEPTVPVEEGLRRIIPQRSGLNAGPALERLGDQLEQNEQEQQRNEQELQRQDATVYVSGALSQAQSEWTQHLQDAQTAAGPGAPNFTPQLMQQYGEYVQKAVKNAPNGLAGMMLGEHLNDYGQELQRRALAFEAQARQDHFLTTAQQSVDAAGTELQNDPSVYTRRLAERLDLIGQMPLDPQDREKLEQYTKENLARYATEGDIARDPFGASAALTSANPKEPYIADLSPALREELIGKASEAFHQRVADAERVDELTKQQDEERAEGIVKQGIMLSQKGQLSAQWVTQHAALLKPSELASLYSMAAGKEATTDLHTYSSLLDSVHAGQDAGEDIEAAFHNGLLSKEDYTRLSDANAAEHPSWFKRGDEYIRTSLQVSQLEPDPAKAQTLANARDDWQNWVTENPKATPQQAASAYHDIVRRYQLVQGNQAMLTLPVPEHFIGSRAAPNIGASKQSLFDAFQHGQINRQQFDREAAVLAQWEQALAFAKQRAAAQAQAGKD